MADSRDPQVIDKNIVDLLGLKDDFELSWEDYFRTLREAAVASRMSESKYSSEDAEVITEELKRVRGVDKETIFVTNEKKKKVKKNKIDPDKITSISKFVKKQKDKNNTKTSSSIVLTNNLVGGSRAQKKSEDYPVEEAKVEKEDKKPSTLLEIVTRIDKTVGSILSTLENQYRFDKESSEKSRRSSEKAEMSSRERKMEAKPKKEGVTTIIKAGEKALSPLQELFSRIKNFLFWVFAAKAFKMFINWFSDPNNKKTFDTIVKFLGDHWVLLLGSWLSFGTSIGRFITKTVVRLGVWTAKMAVIIAKKLIPLIGKLKLGGKGKLLGAAGLGLGVLGASKMMSPKVEKPSVEEQSTPPKADPAPPVEKFDKGGVVNSLERKKEKRDPSQNFNITLEDKEKKKSGVPLELLGSPLVTRFAGPVAPHLSLLSLTGAGEKIPGLIDKAKKSKKLKKVGEGAKEALKFGVSPAYYIFNKFFANKKDKKKSPKIEGRSLGGIAGKALEYSPLGLMFKASKFGAENLGKAASGAGKLAKKSLGGFGGAAKKALKYTPLGLGLSAGKKGLETAGKLTSGVGKVAKKGVKNTLKVASLPFAASLKGLSGVSNVLKGGLLKDPKIQSQFDSVSKKVKETGVDKDPKFIQMGGLPGLSKMILEKTGPEVGKQAKTTKFEKGGINTIDSKDGLPITGAGKDDTLIKAKTGDAVLTKKDQSVLSKAMTGAGIGGLLGGPLGALAGGAIGAGISNLKDQGKETTIAVKKGEAIISPQIQQTIYERFGINIPAWLSKRKPNKVSSNKIKTKSGVNVFNYGGIVPGYFLGGLVGDEASDKGFIPVPTFNAQWMRNFTAVKAVLGPIGKPFKIMSNEEVDAMRQETIDRTKASGGLRVNKDGETSMAWNRVKGEGSGAYTDDLQGDGKSFNSILGRFVAKTKGDGNTLYSDDTWDFNQTPEEYQKLIEREEKKIREGKGGDANYFRLAKFSRILQDIGWLNENPLGKEIKIGKVDPSKPDAPEEKPIEADKKDDGKKAWWDPAGLFTGKNEETKPEEKVKPKDTKVKKLSNLGSNYAEEERKLFEAAEKSKPTSLKTSTPTVSAPTPQITATPIATQDSNTVPYTSSMGPPSSTDIGDNRESAPSPEGEGEEKESSGSGDTKKILEGAKSIIGKGAGVSDQCANTTRAALEAAGHPAASKVTQIGDLDTPKGTGYNAPSFAASFGGSDMGQIITQKSAIKAGDIILWKADRDKGGNINKGAITHVGIAADDGLKNQYDHNSSQGFHYRPHWHSAAGTSWFAGVRLGGSGGSLPEGTEDAGSQGEGASGGGGTPAALGGSVSTPNFDKFLTGLGGGIPKHLQGKEGQGGTGKVGDERGDSAKQPPQSNALNFKDSMEAGLSMGSISKTEPVKKEKSWLRKIGDSLGITKLTDALGLTKEDTGMDIPGAGADRQLIAAQPGEFVIPKDTVLKYGKDYFENLVASTDSNSTPARMGESKKAKAGQNVKPYSSDKGGKPQMMKLPPVNEGGGSSGKGATVGSKEINFDARCPNSRSASERKRIQDVYGIVSGF